MKTSHFKTSCTLLCLILGLGLALTGCKKETPPPEKKSTPTVSEPNETAKEKKEDKEKEFLSDPNVVVCELKQTKISELNLPKSNMASFIRRMERDKREDLKEGLVTLNNHPFKIILGDKPEREFYLYDTETEKAPYWWGSWSLHSYHVIDETYYQFTLLEEGTKLAARPYRGPLGLFQIGKGNRQLEKVEFKGSLRQDGGVGVPIGTIKESWPEAVTECTIPVGDYTSYIMNVTYDNLNICISDNYHTNAQGQPRGEKQTVYGITIREDQPYVLDFSNEPAVVFDQPAKDKTTFKRGEEIKFAAVLVDPKLDIMIRDLDDTSIKVDKEFKDKDGKVIHTAKVNKSLDPNVVIARADGQVVAEGVMPFG
jgi:hypothetical protein